MTDEIKGQMSIFDLLNQDTWCGKMSPERSLPQTARTLEPSLKKPQESLTRPPLFLDLRVDSNGLIQVAYWQIGGALLGAYTMHSFGESPKDGVESRLSQILEDRPHPKYSLSAKACQGILNRANRRGKELPKELKEALEAQANPTPSKLGGGREVDSNGKKAGKGALIQTEKAGTVSVTQDQTLISIDRGGANPEC